MKPLTTSNGKLVRTPRLNIPIGEAIKNNDGCYFLRIKRPKSNDIEELSLDVLFSLVVNNVEDSEKAETP